MTAKELTAAVNAVAFALERGQDAGEAATAEARAAIASLRQEGVMQMGHDVDLATQGQLIIVDLHLCVLDDILSGALDRTKVSPPADLLNQVRAWAETAALAA